MSRIEQDWVGLDVSAMGRVLEPADAGFRVDKDDADDHEVKEHKSHLHPWTGAAKGISSGGEVSQAHALGHKGRRG